MPSTSTKARTLQICERNGLPTAHELKGWRELIIMEEAIRPAAGWTRREADRLFAPQRGGQEEANRLFAPQWGGQEKQLCYSPRSAANKRFHFIIRPAADYVTRHLIGQFW